MKISITTAEGLIHQVSKTPEGNLDLSAYSTSANTQAIVQAAYDAGNWTEYDPPVLTLAEAQAQVSANIRTHANAMREAITKGVTAAEAGAWTNKEAEAKIVQAGETLEPGSMLQAEANASGKTLAEVAERVLGNAAAWRELEGQIAGISSLHRAAVAALTTVEDVQGYDWTVGWPRGD